MPTVYYFPNICESDNQRNQRGGQIIRIATNGMARSRSRQSVMYEDPSLSFVNLTQAQVDEIRQFWLDHKDEIIYVRNHTENTVMTCIFNDPPYSFRGYNEGSGNIRFNGQVNFVQVA